MTPELILYVLIGLTLISYLFGEILDYLNLKAQRQELPEEISGFFDQEKYQRSLAYQREKTIFGFITSAFGVSLSLLMLVFGGFGMLDTFLRNYISNPIVLSLTFFGILMLAMDVLTLPLQWHATFVIEEKYGFNKMTVRTFITDKIKGYLVGAILGGLLAGSLVYLILEIGPNFWVWFGVIAAVVVGLINMFYTSIFLPLFNKLTPLPSGELKDAIQAFAQKVNFPLDNIFVMDGSKRSSKANAFFSGIGGKKKIVLYDTLVEKHTTPELVAVLAHEVGHFKKKHIILSYVLSVIQIFFMLFVLSRMVFNENLSLALGGHQQAIHLNLLAFGMLFSPISGMLGLLMNILSRKNEFEADAYARVNFDAEALAMALKKLSVDTLSNLYPHPWYVFFHHSHPPLLQRLNALRRPH